MVNLRDITERKWAEKELHESERKYRSVVDNVKEVIFQTDAQGLWTFLNPAWAEITGFSVEESIGTNFLNYVHPDDRQRNLELFRPLIERKKDYCRHEIRYLTKDGGFRWIEVWARLTLSDDGTIIGTSGTLNDITERKRVEQALRASEASLAEAQRMAYLGSWETEPAKLGVPPPEHRFRWSDEMYRIFGFAPQQFVPTFKALVEAIHPQDREYVGKAIGGAASRREPSLTIEHRILRPDGEVRFVQVQMEITYDESTELARTFGTVLDITELRMAEEELRRSEERFRALVQNSLDVVSVVDAEATVLYYSPSVEAVMGYKPEEFLGKNALEAFPIHPEDLPQVRDIFGYLVENPGVNYSMEMRMRHADGSWRTIEATANNLLDDPSVGGIVTNYRDITERKTFEKQLEHQAFHDTLTRLPNRTLLIDRLQHALSRIERHQTFIAVLFLDLDNFKVVNDSLGHQVGDELLVAVAKRLQECLRPADTLARLSGDEFVVLLEDISNESEVTRLTERLIRHLQSPFELEHQEEVHITASVGIAFGVSNNDVPDDLLRKADVAMYRAKSRSKAHYEVFNAYMDVDARERLRLQTDLRQAIEREEFALQYQLEFDLVTGDVVGAEALIRWNHPERGVILPEEFIPLAEETGLIVPLGRWVLEEACRQTLKWQRLNSQDPPLTIGVNLSARQFQLPSLAEEIADILQKTGLPPYSLVLEITDSGLLGH